MCSWVGDLIAKSLHINWLHGTSMPKVRVRPSAEIGATNATILYAVVEPIELFVKVHPEAAGAEADGYKTLSQAGQALAGHLVPPLPTEGPPILWLTPHVHADTLHKIVCTEPVAPATEAFIPLLYADFLASLKILWLSSKVSIRPNLREIYCDRIWNRIPRLADTLEIPRVTDLEIIVNGDSKGTFGEIMDEFESRLDTLTPAYSCTIHGDEHAKNIMVYRDQVARRNPQAWVLIDYVNVRSSEGHNPGDWLFSIAKMLQWWQYYCVVELAKENTILQQELLTGLAFDGYRLNVNYADDVIEGLVPQRCRGLAEQALELAAEVANDFEDETWNERLQLALFSVIFGSAPLHLGMADFAVPVMIGESLKALGR